MSVKKIKMLALYSGLLLLLFFILSCKKEEDSPISSGGNVMTTAETKARLEANPWLATTYRGSSSTIDVTSQNRVYTFSSDTGSCTRAGVVQGNGFWYTLDRNAIDIHDAKDVGLPFFALRAYDSTGAYVVVDTLKRMYCFFPDSNTLYMHDYSTMESRPFAPAVAKIPTIKFSKQ